MLVLKFRRVGKKHQAGFRIVVDEKRSKLLGKNLEDLGWYNPHDKKYELNTERILYWLKTGAQPTPTTHNLLVKAGVIKGDKIAVHKYVKKAEEVVTPVPAVPAAAPAAAPAPEQTTS